MSYDVAKLLTEKSKEELVGIIVELERNLEKERHREPSEWDCEKTLKSSDRYKVTKLRGSDYLW